ncbi:GntR family transcriptional regulator [Streptomyces zhaozhouensis]|uniref:GntR family transcriptional regulator n=1 Tax=Streptomyces zhaozhouensis TaxID=1300267 RepID=A0A286E854_9ACTN|nr:GntR family transcriptional regulator [Streptomyces zhaozhouensis]SOD67034.1 GntR family transcriptional regulator [Streptomyces zhaozhouensis]
MYEQVARVSDDVGMSPAPLYRQIADTMRSDITAGRFPPGSKLPSERELIDRFGAARGTVRAGLNVLITEGLITPAQGRGYQVQQHEVFTLDASRHENLLFSRPEDGDSFSNDVRHAGRAPHQEFRVEVTEASAEAAQRLQIEDGGRIVLRYCRRFVDDTPWSIQATQYPQWLVSENPRLSDPGDVVEGTTRYLADRGVKQVAFHDEWATRMPTPDEARELQIGPGIPVLVWVRTGYTSEKRPVRRTVTIFRGDLNRVTYDLGDTDALPTEEVNAA